MCTCVRPCVRVYVNPITTCNSTYIVLLNTHTCKHTHTHGQTSSLRRMCQAELVDRVDDITVFPLLMVADQLCVRSLRVRVVHVCTLAMIL